MGSDYLDTPAANRQWGILPDPIGRLRHQISGEELELGLIPEQARKQICSDPRTSIYDGNLLHITEEWHKSLNGLSSSGSGSFYDFRQYALMRVNYLVKVCRDIFSRQLIPHFVDSSPLLAEAGVETARVVISKMLLMGFGKWLKDPGKESSDHIGPLHCSFDADFVKKDLVYIIMYKTGAVRYIWAGLNFGALFPNGAPRGIFSFVKPHGQIQNPSEMISYLGDCV
ncbi:hypothetical protein F5Y10DRAFT_291688 [Nemania abortiva]|nr:hypothetical protein F5Y10DRAFT_291688 [Nemania abortiva]